MVFKVFEVGSRGFLRHRLAVTAFGCVMFTSTVAGVSYAGYKTANFVVGRLTPAVNPSENEPATDAA